MLTEIKQLCDEQGITVAQLEKMLGWSRSIYKWDTNRPNIDKVVAVANYFGVPIENLLGEESTTTVLHMNDDVAELLDVIRRCSPNEIKTLTRLAKALRGEDAYNAPTTPKTDRYSNDIPQKV